MSEKFPIPDNTMDDPPWNEVSSKGDAPDSINVSDDPPPTFKPSSSRPYFDFCLSLSSEESEEEEENSKGNKHSSPPPEATFGGDQGNQTQGNSIHDSKPNGSNDDD
ncbi:unnamed protein product [Lactuca saligna]|uniref:Uncharacterized protein n=1 Tax=Lactuca saligna TaxID=75948 RepID=A0AA35UT68_LACSI|nr:unnamed protein product [Lactuca saligna]